MKAEAQTYTYKPECTIHPLAVTLRKVPTDAYDTNRDPTEVRECEASFRRIQHNELGVVTHYIVFGSAVGWVSGGIFSLPRQCKCWL